MFWEIRDDKVLIEPVLKQYGPFFRFSHVALASARLWLCSGWSMHLEVKPESWDNIGVIWILQQARKLVTQVSCHQWEQANQIGPSEDIPHWLCESEVSCIRQNWLFFQSRVSLVTVGVFHSVELMHPICKNGQSLREGLTKGGHP